MNNLELLNFIERYNSIEMSYEEFVRIRNIVRKQRILDEDDLEAYNRMCKLQILPNSNIEEGNLIEKLIKYTNAPTTITFSISFLPKILISSNLHKFANTGTGDYFAFDENGGIHIILYSKETVTPFCNNINDFLTFLLDYKLLFRILYRDLVLDKLIYETIESNQNLNPYWVKKFLEGITLISMLEGARSA
jgi:hypothetical protein